jgi:hypothetical protein
METKTKNKRKKHAEEFNREAFDCSKIEADGLPLTVAASLGVAENLLHACKRAYGSAAEQVRKERGGETPEEERRQATESGHGGRIQPKLPPGFPGDSR